MAVEALSSVWCGKEDRGSIVRKGLSTCDVLEVEIQQKMSKKTIPAARSLLQNRRCRRSSECVDVRGIPCGRRFERPRIRNLKFLSEGTLLLWKVSLIIAWKTRHSQHMFSIQIQVILATRVRVRDQILSLAVEGSVSQATTTAHS